MPEKITQKIEEIRQKPEHIRFRYTLGFVLVCMIFVMGVWILTIRQGFIGMKGEGDTGKEQAEEVMNSAKEIFPNSNSLRDLQENQEPLRVNNTENSADQFIEGELKKGATPPPIPNQNQQ